MDLQLKVGITMACLFILSFVILLTCRYSNLSRLEDIMLDITGAQLGVYISIQISWGLIRLWTI